MCRYRWEKADEILVLYLHKYSNCKKITKTIVLNKRQGIKERSLIAKMNNFQYLENGQGLSNYSKLSKEVYDEYKKFSQKVHLEKCKEILGI